jgi:hypothetical protein
MREEYEDTSELAQRTRTSDSYWTKMRVAGEGPPFIKLGRRVLYRASVVDEWLATMARTSTSLCDDGDGARAPSSARHAPAP